MSSTLDIHCTTRGSTAKAHVQSFLNHYALHVDGQRYGVVTENKMLSGEGYKGITEIWPEEGSRITAMIPVQNADMGFFAGTVNELNMPRQMAVILDKRKYVVYENPQSKESKVMRIAEKNKRYLLKHQIQLGYDRATSNRRPRRPGRIAF
jgi:hypothetical protein